MKSLADALPPDIARKIHPDWRKNEAAYWAARDQLLSHYRGQWIAFADGSVLAAASTPLEVFLRVHQSARHPFVTRVGHEDEAWYRIRRATFPYDIAYPSAALPVTGRRAGPRACCWIGSSPTPAPTPRRCLGRTANRCTWTRASVFPASSAESRAAGR